MNGISFIGLIGLLGGAVLYGINEFYCDFFQTCGAAMGFAFFSSFLIATIGFIILLIGTLIERRDRYNDFEEDL